MVFICKAGGVQMAEEASVFRNRDFTFDRPAMLQSSLGLGAIASCCWWTAMGADSLMLIVIMGVISV